MKEIKIIIADSKYTHWNFHCNDTNQILSLDEHPFLETINPSIHRLFNRDVFTIEDDKVNVVQSCIKSTNSIAGVLMLENNKTFGRTMNKKRLYYKCIPDDVRLPAFLLPYEVKLGFSKVQKNKYVVFKFDNWTEKHPYGLLQETLGDVDNLDIFYEYQLYCKSLHISLLDFTNKTRQQLKKNNTEYYIDNILKNSDFKIQDRRNEYVFTIDPKFSTDFDDGYSIEKLENGDYRVSIYIANVFLWLETLGLWNSFSKRVSTIYLPDRRRPMLPNILSDTLCSLQEEQRRFAFVMEFIVSDNTVSNIQYKNVLIQVSRNYYYEEPRLFNDTKYKMLLELSKQMDSNIKDSHDVVAHWMIFMNTQVANLLYDNNSGIFRSVNYINPNVNTGSGIDEETVRVIQSWNNTIGQYLEFDGNVNIKHDFMKSKYLHITSPIRRLVDLLNQIILFDKEKLLDNISEEAVSFLKKWLGELDYLNTSMRSIRKIQTDCALLDRCYSDPFIMNKEYSGILFDKVVRDNLTMGYMVYLKELKMLSRINVSIDVDNFSLHKFKMYLFENEDKTKKKIRLQLLDK
jgi:exoribonuclease R